MKGFGIGIGMEHTKTVGLLYSASRELSELLTYFDYSVGGDSHIVASEIHRGDFESYDYDAIYKKIYEVVERISSLKIVDDKERTIG